MGKADDTWGEVVVAFVVLKPAMALSYEELKSWCESRMSSYKVPKQLVTLAELPRNAMGKVTKSLLKEQACNR
jgi:malonyl-CoA/methylmalonyl-CoA synthetase